MSITTEVELDEHEMVLMDVQIFGNLLPFIKQFKEKVVRKRHYNSVYHYGILFIGLTHKDIIEIDEYLQLNYGSSALNYNPHDTTNMMVN